MTQHGQTSLQSPLKFQDRSWGIPLARGRVCQGGLKGAIQEQVAKMGVVTELSQPGLRSSLAF